MSNTRYANGDDLLKRYDARVIGDLVSDNGTRVSVNLNINSVLLGALDDASGMIESAVYVGKRYTAEHLSGLTNNSLSLLKRLTCDLAFEYLRTRRANDVKQSQHVDDTFEYLNRLRLGERVFDVAEVEAAGNMTSDAISIATLRGQHLVSGNTRVFPIKRYTTGQ